MNEQEDVENVYRFHKHVGGYDSSIVKCVPLVAVNYYTSNVRDVQALAMAIRRAERAGIVDVTNSTQRSIDEGTGEVVAMRHVSFKVVYGSQLMKETTRWIETALGEPVENDELSERDDGNGAAVFGSTKRRKVNNVVFDALNFLRRFIPENDDIENVGGISTERILQVASNRVRTFCNALTRTGVKAAFVFDCGQNTPETGNKWRERRFREIVDENKRLILGADVWFQKLLQDEGFEIYSRELEDGDDAVVSIALALDAHVVSEDGDMSRYVGFPIHRVLVDFAIREGLVVFNQRQYCVPRSLRTVQAAPENFRHEPSWNSFHSRSRERILATGVLKMGNPHSHVKRFGNLFSSVCARHLRAALYSRWGVNNVREITTEWDAITRTPTMLEFNNQANPDYELILDDLHGIYNMFTQSLGVDFNTPNEILHSIAFVSAELFNLASQTPSQNNLFAAYYQLIGRTVPVSMDMGNAQSLSAWAKFERCLRVVPNGSNTGARCQNPIFPYAYSRIKDRVLDAHSRGHRSAFIMCNSCLNYLIQSRKMSREQLGIET